MSRRNKKSISEQQETQEKHVHLVLLGNAKCGVGKTALRVRAFENRFQDEYTTTIGRDYNEIYMHNCFMHVCDTSSETLINCSIPQSSGIICYDVTNRLTFNNVFHWILVFRGRVGDGPHVVALVATKADSPHRVVTEEEGRALAHLLNITMFFETSALCDTQQQILDVFGEIVDAAGMLAQPTRLAAKNNPITKPKWSERLRNWWRYGRYL